MGFTEAQRVGLEFSKKEYSHKRIDLEGKENNTLARRTSTGDK